jgi:hypothetical protein
MTRAVLGLAACALALSGCAWSRDAIVMPIEYRLAGADSGAREGLVHGLQRLDAGDHPGALAALNRALWDLQRLDRRLLRMEEVATLYEALGRAYLGLHRQAWAREHAELAVRVRQAAERGREARWVQTRERARQAYVAARFRDARAGLQDLLVDLEDVIDPATRVRQAEMARCYLAFTHFALGDEERVRDELHRLAALDGTLAACRGPAPPAVRGIIARVQAERAARP